MDHFLSAYYFTWLLLHVSATMCHPQGAGVYLLSYMPIWVLVDKILCSIWLCVYYVATWCVWLSGALPPFPYMRAQSGHGQLYFWETLVEVVVVLLAPVPHNVMLTGW
jgi:hypothetical protein